MNGGMPRSKHNDPYAAAHQAHDALALMCYPQ